MFVSNATFCVGGLRQYQTVAAGVGGQMPYRLFDMNVFCANNLAFYVLSSGMEPVCAAHNACWRWQRRNATSSRGAWRRMT